MNRGIDLDAILAPFPGDNPSGEDLRYTDLYGEIRGARKSEDDIPMGEWQRETKSADWERVITASVEGLATKSKDLQIAAWLCEGLVVADGFEGLSTGLAILERLVADFWETVYPVMEDGDIEFRLAPFEFLNDRLSTCIRQVPLTTAGYSWLTWQESRDVGSEADTRNRFGDVDDAKAQRRDEMIAEGKISSEQFDAAAAQTPQPFRLELAVSLASCKEAFAALDARVDEFFGQDAPRISGIGEALEDCSRLVARLYGEQQVTVPAASPEDEIAEQTVEKETPSTPQKPRSLPTAGISPSSGGAAVSLQTIRDTGMQESVIWDEAQRLLDSGNMKDALDRLLAVSYSMPSERERNRYRLMIAKLCIKADRRDLARPIVEGLHALIDELHLERWESPLWIAEVLEALYQCLTSGEAADEDPVRAQELFRRLCAMDVTKAILYRIS